MASEHVLSVSKLLVNLGWLLYDHWATGYKLLKVKHVNIFSLLWHLTQLWTCNCK